MTKNENTAAETGELPPLPLVKSQYGFDSTLSFSANDMRDYARAAIAAYLAQQEQAEPVAWQVTTIAPEGRKPLVFFAYTEESARFTHSQYNGSTLTPLYATSVSQAPVAQAVPEEIVGVNIVRLLRNLEETSYNEGAMDLACRLSDCHSVIKALLAAPTITAASARDQALEEAATKCEQIGCDWLDAGDHHKEFAADYLAKQIRALKVQTGAATQDTKGGAA